MPAIFMGLIARTVMMLIPKIKKNALWGFIAPLIFTALYLVLLPLTNRLSIRSTGLESTCIQLLPTIHHQRNGHWSMSVTVFEESLQSTHQRKEGEATSFS